MIKRRIRRRSFDSKQDVAGQIEEIYNLLEDAEETVKNLNQDINVVFNDLSIVQYNHKRFGNIEDGEARDLENSIATAIGTVMAINDMLGNMLKKCNNLPVD